MADRVSSQSPRPPRSDRARERAAERLDRGEREERSRRAALSSPLRRPQGRSLVAPLVRRASRANGRAPAKETEDRSRTPRLDQPRETRRPLVKRPTVDQDAFGSFAEKFARFMGTARFLIYMTLFVAVWLVWNLVAPHGSRFDAYPFIFLTLMLSLQASYAAPLILLAQNRQELRDRVVTEQDRQGNTRAHADMEFLTREVAALRMSVGEMATRDFLRSELRTLLSELDERAAEPEDDSVTDEDGGTDREPGEIRPAAGRSGARDARDSRDGRDGARGRGSRDQRHQPPVSRRSDGGH